jgi:succinate-semialdehyde dehydrogenase/glutarate-semialdehyde dehydrogenase
MTLSKTLSDPALFRRQAFIDGGWRNADDGGTFDVFNPADGAKIGTAPDMMEAEAKRAVEAAGNALAGWRSRTAKERAGTLKKWNDLILENADDLARLMTAEMGKPLTEARGEVVYGASFIEWFAEEGKRLYGDIIPPPLPGRRILVVKQPVGVIAAITPWNFPSAMITRKCAPALAAGCTVVVKPAKDTPYSALALAELAMRAGFPAGVFNVITGNAKAIGAELTSNPTVRKVSFTGSTEIGKLLMSQCAATVKKVSLELGGNAPFIVFADADIDAAVAGLMASKYRNSGQTCVCANRILVQSAVYDVFAEKLTAAVGALKVAPGLEVGASQGPLINEQGLEKVERLVADALAKGAKVALGGKRHELGGTFFEPTILTGVNGDMALANEEIFGPVAPLYRFETEEEAVRLANDTPFGLAAYFYSRDLARAWRVSEELEYGIVGVNEGMISTEAAPFGGLKESGLGREGSKYGIDEFVEIKYICMGGIGD